MKKIILLVLSFFITLGLTSCDTAQSVSIVDENGEEVQIEISKTDDEEVVKNALTYAAQAEYEQLDKLQVKSNIEFGAGAKVDGQKVEASIKVSADTKLSEEGFSSSMSLSVFTEDVYDGEVEKNEVSMEADLYYELEDSANVYADTKFKMGEEEQELKAKIALEDLYEMLLGMGDIGMPLTDTEQEEGSVAGGSGEAFDDLDIEQLLAELDPETLFTALETYLPNSKLEISGVNSKTFTVRLSVSMNDVLKVSSDSDSSFQLAKDFNLDFDFSFNTKNGQFCKFAFEFKDMNALKSVLELAEASEEDYETLTSIVFKASFEVSYEDKDIEKLTSVEKLQYLPL